MKFYRRHGANIIESKTLVSVAGFLSAGSEGYEKAMAAAFFPFMFVRNVEFATPIFVNHERIHFAQQLETLFIGSIFIHLVEDLYSGLFKRLKAEERYLFRSSEQEAYRNQENFDYLSSRRFFSQFKYIKDKRKLSFIDGSAPRVLIGEKF